jgi:hypothetical protein
MTDFANISHKNKSLRYKNVATGFANAVVA